MYTPVGEPSDYKTYHWSGFSSKIERISMRILLSSEILSLCMRVILLVAFCYANRNISFIEMFSAELLN